MRGLKLEAVQTKNGNVGRGREGEDAIFCPLECKVTSTKIVTEVVDGR